MRWVNSYTTLTDQNASAQARLPMAWMRQGKSTRSFQAEQSGGRCRHRHRRHGSRAGCRTGTSRPSPSDWALVLITDSTKGISAHRLHSTLEVRGGSAEHTSRTFQQLRTPLRYLIGMNVELLGRVSQRLLALMAASATFALKAGLWFRPILPGSSTHSARIDRALCPRASADGTDAPWLVDESFHAAQQWATMSS